MKRFTHSQSNFQGLIFLLRKFRKNHLHFTHSSNQNTELRRIFPINKRKSVPFDMDFTRFSNFSSDNMIKNHCFRIFAVGEALSSEWTLPLREKFRNNRHNSPQNRGNPCTESVDEVRQNMSPTRLVFHTKKY